MSELIRANKVTARFEGEGVIVGTFYKTHDKLGEVKSNSTEVVGLGYKMPESIPASEGVEPVEVTPKQKLDSFKEFLQVNATAFGFTYDPIDRRNNGNKYPSKYDEPTLLDTATKILSEKMGELVASVQKTVDGYIKNKIMDAGSQITCNIGVGNIAVQEKYKNENLKYADATFPVTVGIGAQDAVGPSIALNVVIKLVSGQIKKPRELDKYPMTITGLKTALVEGKVLPEPPKKEEKKEDTDKTAEVANSK